jgi:hypothetical protein
MMAAVCTSATSVCSNETTRRYIPEGCCLHTRRLESLKSHIKQFRYACRWPVAVTHLDGTRYSRLALSFDFGSVWSVPLTTSVEGDFANSSRYLVREAEAMTHLPAQFDVPKLPLNAFPCRTLQNHSSVQELREERDAVSAGGGGRHDTPSDQLGGARRAHRADQNASVGRRGLHARMKTVPGFEAAHWVQLAQNTALARTVITLLLP